MEIHTLHFTRPKYLGAGRNHSSMHGNEQQLAALLRGICSRVPNTRLSLCVERESPVKKLHTEKASGGPSGSNSGPRCETQKASKFGLS